MSYRHSSSDTDTTPVSSYARARDANRLVLVRSEARLSEALDDAPLAFDVDDDVAAIIPMPPSIPASIRAAITRALGEQFEFADDLHEWLHAPCEALAGKTPFERVVAGDGAAVLLALYGAGESSGVRREHAGTSPEVRAMLRVVR